MLEETGQWDRAENVYFLGLENEARPIRDLAREFKEFKKRMNEAMRTTALTTQQPTSMPSAAAMNDNSATPTISTTSTEKRKADATADLSSETTHNAKQARTNQDKTQPQTQSSQNSTNMTFPISKPFIPVSYPANLTQRLSNSIITTVAAPTQARTSVLSAFVTQAADGTCIGYDPALLSEKVGNLTIECCFRERMAQSWLEANFKRIATDNSSKTVVLPTKPPVDPTSSVSINKAPVPAATQRPVEEKRSLASMATPLKSKTPSRNLAKEQQREYLRQQQKQQGTESSIAEEPLPSTSQEDISSAKVTSRASDIAAADTDLFTSKTGGDTDSGADDASPAHMSSSTAARTSTEAKTKADADAMVDHEFGGHTDLFNLDDLFAATGHIPPGKAQMAKNKSFDAENKRHASPTVNTRMAAQILDDVFAETPQKKSTKSVLSKTTDVESQSIGASVVSAPGTTKNGTLASSSSKITELSVEALTRQALASALPAVSSSPLRLTGDSDNTACIGAIFGNDATTNFTTDETGDVTRMCMLEARLASNQRQQAASSISFYCDEDDEEGRELAANTLANARGAAGKGLSAGMGLSAKTGLGGITHNSVAANVSVAAAAPDAKRMSTIRSRFETTRKSVTGNALGNIPGRKSMTSRKSLMMGTGSGAGIDDEEFDRQQSQENQKFLAMFANSGDFDDFDDVDFLDASAPTKPPTTAAPKRDTVTPPVANNENSVATKLKASTGGLKARGLSAKPMDDPLPTISERGSSAFDDETMSTMSNAYTPLSVATTVKPARKGLGVLQDKENPSTCEIPKRNSEAKGLGLRPAAGLAAPTVPAPATCSPVTSFPSSRTSIGSTGALFADDEEVPKKAKVKSSSTGKVPSLIEPSKMTDAKETEMETLSLATAIDLHDANLRYYQLLQALHALLSPNLEKSANNRAMRTLYGNEAIRTSFNIPGIEGKRSISESVSKHVVVNIIDDSESSSSSCPISPKDIKEAYLSAATDPMNWSEYNINDDLGLSLDLELDETQYFFNTLFRDQPSVPLHAVSALTVVSDANNASGEIEHAKVTVGGLNILLETYILAVLQQRLGKEEASKHFLMPKEAGKSAYVYIHPKNASNPITFKQLPSDYEPLIENHSADTKLSEEQALLRLRLCHSIGIANTEDDDVYEKPNAQLRLSVPSSADFVNDDGIFTMNNPIFGTNFATVITAQQQRSPVYTLGDVIRLNSTKKGTIFTEPLLVYTTVQMLKSMLRAHSAGVIHTSISAHSFLVKIPDVSASSNWGEYTGKDTEQWDEYGLLLTEWCDSTDLALVPQPFSGFKYNPRVYAQYMNPYYTTTAEEDMEDEPPSKDTYMLRGSVSETVKVWGQVMDAVGTKAASQFVFEPDVYGVLSIVYTVLMNGTVQDGNGPSRGSLAPTLELVKTAGKILPKNKEFTKLNSESPLNQLYLDIFDNLLNIPKFASDTPIDVYMREYITIVTNTIAKLESYLTSNSKMSATLKADICRQNTMLQM